MIRPPFEVADIIRRSGSTFIDCYRNSLTWGQLKVLRAIERCRTAALGGHRDRCLDCRYRSAISFHSCRNRHTAPSARPTRGRSGCAPDRMNCCR